MGEMYVYTLSIPCFPLSCRTVDWARCISIKCRRGTPLSRRTVDWARCMCNLYMTILPSQGDDRLIRMFMYVLCMNCDSALPQDGRLGEMYVCAICTCRLYAWLELQLSRRTVELEHTQGDVHNDNFALSCRTVDWARCINI